MRSYTLKDILSTHTQKDRLRSFKLLKGYINKNFNVNGEFKAKLMKNFNVVFTFLYNLQIKTIYLNKLLWISTA